MGKKILLFTSLCLFSTTTYGITPRFFISARQPTIMSALSRINNRSRILARWVIATASKTIAPVIAAAKKIPLTKGTITKAGFAMVAIAAIYSIAKFAQNYTSGDPATIIGKATLIYTKIFNTYDELSAIVFRHCDCTAFYLRGYINEMDQEKRKILFAELAQKKIATLDEIAIEKDLSTLKKYRDSLDTTIAYSTYDRTNDDVVRYELMCDLSQKMWRLKNALHILKDSTTTYRDALMHARHNVYTSTPVKPIRQHNLLSLKK